MDAAIETSAQGRDEAGSSDPGLQRLDEIAISVRSHRLLQTLLRENPRLDEILSKSRNETEALAGIRNWAKECLDKNPDSGEFLAGRAGIESLRWKDHAAIRLLDYVDHAGREFSDLNLRGQIAVSNPVKMLWLAANRGTGGAKPDFFDDMLELFRQFSGSAKLPRHDRAEVEGWMERYPSGLDPRIVELRRENRERILRILIRKLDAGEIRHARYQFEEGMSEDAKMELALEWWKESSFHLMFAVRSPKLLNNLLGNSLDPDTMTVLREAEAAGIPFFVNPYYLSLLHVRVPYFAVGADLAIRDYVLYSRQLVREFGKIVAWEKEDIVEPGKPNAAGWLLPSRDNVHRRYPEVAILIPDTMGRACAGLCASCQRMYDFQRGHLNFNLDKLKPHETWPEKLRRLMDYFENDSQLRDVLITGGDALMSADSSLRELLDAVHDMAVRKRKANEARPDGDKYFEISRVRLGTRLPVYLPQRITPELVALLREFKEKATKIGIRQFVIQTHFNAPMEITPESREAVQRLVSAGWTVTNQHVFTAAASRRGHNARLRQVLDEIGALPYYTFTVKGYMENHHSFTPNARALQEQREEKIIGSIPDRCLDAIREFPHQAEGMIENIATMRETENLPFLATDRNVLNLPGVGKSLTFRVIGITRYGRRILEFEHDATRRHSPIIDRMGKMIVIESKSISEYLRQLRDMGEETAEYDGLYGYSIGRTEARMPLYDHAPPPFRTTDKLTNFALPKA